MKKRLEYGYDRHNTSWVIIVFDEDGNEITSSYVGNKEDRDIEINYYKEMYSIEQSNVIKIKAY